MEKNLVSTVIVSQWQGLRPCHKHPPLSLPSSEGRHKSFLRAFKRRHLCLPKLLELGEGVEITFADRPFGSVGISVGSAHTLKRGGDKSF
jgi:hypothetical protein